MLARCELCGNHVGQVGRLHRANIKGSRVQLRLCKDCRNFERSLARRDA